MKQADGSRSNKHVSSDAVHFISTTIFMADDSENTPGFLGKKIWVQNSIIKTEKVDIIINFAIGRKGSTK